MSANGRARSTDTAPAAIVATLVAMSAGKSGTAMRFASGETSEMRPKMPATIGSVGSVAASVAASPSPAGDGTHARRLASGAWNARSPAVAPALSRKLASPMVAGSTASMTAIAAQRPFAAAARRPRARPSDVIPAMTALRTTLAPSPTRRL